MGSVGAHSRSGDMMNARICDVVKRAGALSSQEESGIDYSHEWPN